MREIANTPSFVVLGDYTYPDELDRAAKIDFFIPEDVAQPEGDPSNSNILDLSTGTCLNVCQYNR